MKRFLVMTALVCLMLLTAGCTATASASPDAQQPNALPQDEQGLHFFIIHDAQGIDNLLLTIQIPYGNDVYELDDMVRRNIADHVREATGKEIDSAAIEYSLKPILDMNDYKPTVTLQ